MLEKIEGICCSAVAHDAEDVFLKAGGSPSMRVKGQILVFENECTEAEEMEALAEACGVDTSQGEADVSWKSSSTGMRFRVNFYSSMGRSCAVLRLLNEVTAHMGELGLPEGRLQNWLSRESGLILVTGATGSGKSTSLASCLNWVIDNESKHVVTIEDPIEYRLKVGRSIVSQREVGADTESFQQGLRAALRQSPDVILVGEIRDYETAKVALHACETGHLVVSTLHSSNVGETMDRLLMLFPEGDREGVRLVLSKQLIGVLSQKLVPSMDNKMCLLVEHVEIAGAVKKWMQDGEIYKISDYVKDGSGGENVSYIQSIMQAYKGGIISEEVAKSSCEDPNEFGRVKMGVSTGSR